MTGPEALLNLIGLIPDAKVEQAPGDQVQIRTARAGDIDTIHDTIDAIWPGRCGNVFGNNRLLFWIGDQ